MTSTEVDTGGWAEALDFCAHVEQSLIMPKHPNTIPDLSKNIECCIDNCSFQVSICSFFHLVFIMIDR